ncbi:MAG: hypothetical protein CMD81_14485 [Gammaproteobacteria bacterium]|nr:TolC family protein [Alteromonas macleodii]MBK85025.1 hypothetical protein [Gammaproteobacteria bacterium]|tara:strand:+ start:61279 stop:62658 length:1380 start_codon:yes stop_codon:yes gene_type:complete
MNKMKKFVTITALAGALSACAAGPDYHKPAKVNSIQTKAYEQSQAAYSWWGIYQDATLNQLITKALEENRTLSQAQANVTRALSVFKDAKNDYLPQASLDANYQASKNATVSATDDNIVSRGNQLGANASWVIDLNGKLRRASEAALAQAQEADYLWKEAQLEIISQVALTYGQYRGAELRLKVAEQNLENLQQSRKIVRAQFQSGVASELELARMDAQVFEVQSSIPQHRSDLQRAKATLASLVAMSSESLKLLDAKFPTLETPFAFANAQDYLKNIPSIAAKERALAAASANIGVATADLYPEVHIGGFLGFFTGTDYNLNSNTQSWSVVPSISWNVLNYGSTQAKIKASKATTLMALADFEQTVFNALNEMDYSIQSYNNSRQQELLMDKQVKANEKAVYIARQRYNAGTGDFLSLLDTERELLRARDQQAQVQVQTFSRTVNVYKAFGGGLTPQS